MLNYLAIKGHPTRGNEVIEILKMLGGENKLEHYAMLDNYIYFIGMNKIIRLQHIDALLPGQYVIYSLEEFEEKFPYKVGDKVCYQLNNTIYISEIISMEWADNSVIYFTSNGHSLRAYDLQPYKEDIVKEEEENFAECIEKTIQECLFGKEGATKEIKINIPEGYEFFGIDNNNKVVFTKIQPQYPKTYAECCKVLGISDGEFMFTGLSDDEYDLFDSFVVIKRCRDAYWKIAGEELGLGKPWKQDYDDRCFIVANNNGNIHTYEYHGTDNVILAFPTEEMRDEFYENFEEVIEKCKELL